MLRKKLARCIRLAFTNKAIPAALLLGSSLLAGALTKTISDKKIVSYALAVGSGIPIAAGATLYVQQYQKYKIFKEILERGHREYFKDIQKGDSGKFLAIYEKETKNNELERRIIR